MESRKQSFTKGPKDYLKALVDSKQLTPDGRNWLTLALDPFHDTETQIAGYPDADCSQTTVSCYQYQTDITAPAAAGTGNWDAHIYTLPVAKMINASIFTLDANWRTQTEPTPTIQDWVQAPLVIDTNKSGNSLAPSIPAAAGPMTHTGLPGYGVEDLSSGITRVIGMGFEVTNTTAEINKQGSLTCYRMPQLGNSYQMKTVSNGTLVAPVVGTMWRAPPTSVMQANLLKGTRTWSAAEGCYCTVMQNSVHNPLMQEESQQFLYSDNSAPGTAAAVRATQYDALGAAATAPNASCVTFPPNQAIPFDTTGVFLMGLSNSTTLTVKLKVYVERAPTWADPALSVLASPSAAYDVRALELYAQAVNCLPPGVKVSENAFGDWWKAVMSVLKNAAGTVGLAINPFVPGAALVGNAISSAAGALATIPFNTSKGMSVSKQLKKEVDKRTVKVVPQVKRIPPKRK